MTETSRSGERPRIRNRRALARLPTEICALVLWEDLILGGMITDLGTGGLFIECDDQAPFGASVIVCMAHPSGPLQLPGTVRWNGERGMGVQFDALPAHEAHAILEFLNRAMSADPFTAVE